MIFHSSFELIYLLLPLTGFFIGFFTSLIGGGGGFFFIPLLILLYGVPAQIAIPTSLAATLPICIIGSIGHYRMGNINIHIGIIFAVAGIAGAVSGAAITRLITPGQLKTGFGIYSVLIATHMIISNITRKKAEIRSNIKEGLNVKRIFLSSFYGLMGGMITGTFGTNGTAPVLAGLFALGIPVKLVIGTSLMVVLVNAVSALSAHFLIGEIDLTLVYFLTAGTISGAFTGPKLLAGIKTGRAEGHVRYIYALGMIIFGIIIILYR